MGAFSDKIRAFSVKAQADAQVIFVKTCIDAKESIVNGSALTGAPGQPRDTNALAESWQLEFESPTRAIIATDLPYAESNEDGIARPGGGPYVQRSQTGGRHSLSKTIDGLQALVEDNAKRLSEGSNA